MSIIEWVDDNIITHCSKCNLLFTILNRKHHCRYCGKIYCSKCSNYFINIPEEARINILIKKNNIFDIRNYINTKPILRDRVCYKCYNEIVEWKELNRFYELFSLLPLEITDYLQIRLVCKNWYKIANYHLCKIKEIQNRLTDKEWNNYELNMLYINRHLLNGHSRWIFNYIISISLNNGIVNVKLDDIILHNRIIGCNIMMCNKGCNNRLSYEDLILLIIQCKKENVMNEELIKWIFNKLDNVDITTDELLCTLNIIIHSLKKIVKDEIGLYEIYEKFLLKRAKTTKKISNKLFWILTELVNQSVDNKVSIYFRDFRKKLVDILDDETYNQFQYGYDFTRNIIHILTLHPERRISAIKEFINDISYQRFYLPIDITKTFHGIDTDKIYIINSKTEPIVIPCIYDSNELYNIMLKRENVKNEELMMNMIKLVDILLKKEELLDLNIMLYNIQPVNINGLNDYGYIEFVSNSYTLYSIKEEYKFTLQNFILEKNPYMSINEFRNKFAKSCAAYCVISYVFGIGDRHLDNIMVTNDGTLFNIDYGYILGREPKPISSVIRITPDMIDALGGIASIHYREFIDWCGVAYNCIRRHINLFYNMLLMLDEREFSREYIRNYIVLRFMPSISDKEAHNKFIKIVENSYDNYKNNIIDYFHKQYRSSDKSDEVNENDIVNNVSDWMKEKINKWIPKKI